LGGKDRKLRFKVSLGKVIKTLTQKQNRNNWAMPIILVTQEAEIRRMAVQRQPWQIVHETLPQKIKNTKKGKWSGSRGRVPAQQA
jgi:hypothetical protein